MVLWEMTPTCVQLKNMRFGTIVEEKEEGSIPLPNNPDLYLLPKTDVPEGKLADPDKVCAFSGTFRKSSATNGI